MITFKDYMDCINYRVTGGSAYGWQCYGENVHLIDSETEDFTISVVFDTVNQTVYEIEAWDYKRDVVYRWIHPNYIKAVKKEYKKRGLKFKNATDDQKYIDLDVEEDIMEKMIAIAAGEEYDDRVMISMDLDDETLAIVARAAHIKDITINEFFVDLIEQIVAEGKDNGD